MAIFRYLTFVCEQSELQDVLTKHGQEGWRLHTCDPVVAVGPQGSGLVHAFVVMDQFVEDEDEIVMDAQGEGAQEGIAMKG